MYLRYAKLKNKKDLSFLEIKLSNIIHNYSTIKSFVDDEVIVASVVKADAYGIGILKVVKILYNIGCQHFFVNTIEEGISIRKHINNKNVSIYILTGYFGTNEYKKYNLIPIINSIYELELFQKKYKNKIQCAIKIDTGLSRRGLTTKEIKKYKERIRDINPQLIISHLICQDRIDNNVNEKQLSNFLKVKEILDDEYKYSLTATSGLFLDKKYHFDMIRVGAGLYGLVENKKYKDQFLKVFSLYAKVLQIKHIDQGCSIGYNNSFVAKKNMTIAILGIGYADGLNFYTKYFTYVNNKKCEFIGKMSMNYSFVNISDIDINKINVGNYLEINCNDSQRFELITQLKTKIIYS